MMFDITIWGALIAGLISFLSPCVLPLVPAYLGFLGGTTIDQLTGEDGNEVDSGAKRQVIFASLFFVLGLTAVFVSLGAAASYVGGFLAVYKNELGMAAGVFIIIFGLHFLGILKIPLLYRSAKVDVQVESASLAGAFLMGMAFAFGWTPCVGPVLAPILTLAGNSETVMQGVGLLFVYSMGLGIPFVLAAVAVTPFMGFMGKFRKHMAKVEKVMGLLLIITGVLFITGSFGYFGINSIGVWILDMFPALATLG
ncbi:MAG: cytochrome c biogenesis protein CcdA [bacterium]|nr:cytochrome c biogenesis protein CcdA [bacterium]